MQKTASAHAVETDEAYHQFEKLVAERIAKLDGPIFTTDANERGQASLFDLYLAGIPENRKQHYNCHACRRFITAYGGLAQVTTAHAPGGLFHSAIWSGLAVPKFFGDSVAMMNNQVLASKITGVFYGPATWGTPKSYVTSGALSGVLEWTHLSGTHAQPYKGALLSATQASAAKKDEFGMLQRGLADFPREAVVQALRVLEADVLDRSEKTLGVAQWLLKLHDLIGATRGQRRDNVVWWAVATAPAGWCHVRSTMINTLLEDIVAGLPFETIKSRWDTKMHPLAYQRPDPTRVKEGTLIQANKLMTQLQSAGALRRRYAKLSDVLAPLWMPSMAPRKQDVDAAGRGPFDHLRPASKSAIKPVELPTRPVTWETFRVEVLPAAYKIEVYCPYSGPYYGLVTAADPNAPPVLQWDSPEFRNPVSWYFYNNGSTAQQWHLSTGWQECTAIFLKPGQWHEPEKFKHHGDGVFFAIRGAKDGRMKNGGSFFPEMFKSEYHGIRAALEAYAASAEVEGREEGDANGLALTGKNNVMVRVTDRHNNAQTYNLGG